ncbi:MAG: FtsK/SpoIIIE family proteinFtsk gamma protein, partial [Acidimicrobiaceae bacterium]|nr:FtsK/SpoIIIE family proteinFtsk gamma protein [Acidimicrobiaceae bacterium]
MLGRIAAAIARQPDEVWAWSLLVVGVLLVLGLYANLLGWAGAELRRLGSLGLGWGLDVLPIAALLAGLTLLRGRARRGVVGLIVALAVLAAAASGLADLAGGLPHWSAPSGPLGGAGGLLGAAIGGALHSFLGTAGAAVVFGALSLPAAAGLSGIPVRSLLLGTGRAARTASGALAGSLAKREPTEEEAAAILERLTMPVQVIDWPLYGPTSSAPSQSAGHELSLEEESEAPLVPPASEDELSLLVDEVDPDEAPTSGALELAPAGAAQADPSSGASEPVLPGSGAERGDPKDEAGPPEQLGLGLVPPPSQWKLPSVKLLARSKEQGLDRRAVQERGKALERALLAHGVETHLVDFTVGPTVTRFELELGAGVKVARVTSLAKDIAYAMASPDVRILAPIPGRSAIGVEVPNQDRQLVTLGDVLSSPEARRASHPLEVALGRDIAGRAVMANLAEMPHLLIAGATGAGKSSCINSVITSILMRATPEQVRLILIDPKRVELGQYNGLPHLLTQVVVNPKRAANALSWAVTEMERRYDLLAEVGMRDITGYNAAYDRGDFAEGPFDEGPIIPGGLSDDGDGDGDGEPSDADSTTAQPDPPAQQVANSRYQRLPFILIVVDELNDLMMVAARDVEESICRIAQMARAVGIHLVIATQRPSVDVITGVIKANVPSRLAFSVSSLADSRVILDQPGAERLVGRGDLLLLTASSSIPRRIQGPWVSEEEVRTAVGQWRRQSAPAYLEGVVGEEREGAAASGASEDDDDELLRQALELVVRSQLG